MNNARRIYLKQSAALGVSAMTTGFAAKNVSAQLKIEVTGVGANQLPVGVAPFPGDSTTQSIAEIIRADLSRTGLLRVVDAGNPLPPLSENALPNWSDWKGRGIDALVTGSVEKLADGRYDVRFRLHDTVKQTALGGFAVTESAARVRQAGHRIADWVHEKLTGEPGVFATRIAYVLRRNGQYYLQVADSDGYNAQTALASKEPIISPTWSPDGAQIALVSFESRKPVVYVLHLASGRRTPVAAFKGSNSAPAWAPDGRKLAVVLTRDGNSQIYTVDLNGANLRRISQSSAIDTEPTWSADGQSIWFTSDRGGAPQIYQMSSEGQGVTRVTFAAPYCVSPKLSPDGKTLAYIARRDGLFQVMARDLASGQEQAISDGGRDESPSFAPNSRMVLYASDAGGRGVLAAASIDGRIKFRLSGAAGDIREPSWGPFSK